MRPDDTDRVERREWFLVAGWALFILAATSVPLPGGGLDRPVLLFGFLEADKLAHAAMYAVLGWLTVGALDAARMPPLRSVLVGLAAAAVFAAVDEWHQAWIPARTPDVMDWAADAVGLAAGAVARRLRGGRDGDRPERSSAGGERQQARSHGRRGPQRE